jgi:hypothetical protein
MFRIICTFEPGFTFDKRRFVPAHKNYHPLVAAHIERFGVLPSGQWRISNSYDISNVKSLGMAKAFADGLYAVSPKKFNTGSICNPAKELKKIIQPRIDKWLFEQELKTSAILDAAMEDIRRAAPIVFAPLGKPQGESHAIH